MSPRLLTSSALPQSRQTIGLSRSVTLNWGSAIPPVNNQLTDIGWGETISGKGSDNPANSFMQAILNFESFQKNQKIYQIPHNNIKIGNDMLYC